MKFKIDTSELQRIVTQAGASVLKHTMNPMFQSILIQTLDKTLVQAVGQRLEASSVSLAKADIGDQGAAVISHALFAASVSKLRPGKVTLEIKGQALELRTKGSKYRFPCVAPEEYPEVPVMPKENRFTVPREEFTRVIKAVTPSLGRENARDALKSIRFQFGSNGIRATSSDGIRISSASDSLVKAQGLDQDVTLPGSGAQILFGVLSSLSDETAQVAFSDRIWVQVPGVACSVQLGPESNKQIDFGPYLSEPEIMYEVDRSDLLQAFRRLSVFGTNVVLDCSESEIKLSVEGEKGQGSERIQAKGSGSLLVKVGAGPFVDGLSLMRSDRVLFGGKDLNIVTVRDGHQIHGAMPIAVKQ